MLHSAPECEREGARQLRRSPWAASWFRVDLRSVTLEADTDVYVGQDVEQAMLVTWKEKKTALGWP